MRFVKNNIWTICLMALFCMFGFAGDAAAGGGNSVMGAAQGKAREVFYQIKTVIFIVGGFGLVGVAWGAIWGKLNWKWFAALAVGLAILAAAGSIIEYATGSSDVGITAKDSFGQM